MSITVTEAGTLSTLQDRGRVGHAHLGVARAGALDDRAAALANRILGNPVGAAVVETTMTGLTLVAGRNLWIAVTGARCEVVVAGRARAHGEPVFVHAGEQVLLGPASSGVRSYLAVAGGFDVAPVLGSRATDTLAGVGPPVLADGVELPVGTATGAPRPVETPLPPATGPLRVVPGPRVGWFAPDAMRRLCTTQWVVGPDSNRIGLRLQGEPLSQVRTGELPSEGMVLGAVQVPPSGEPVVFLADHPVTGGYPVLAVVHHGDLHRCAQLRPGEQVAFSQPLRG